MPGASVFIDTNVLLYARDEEPSDLRSATAATWLRRLAAERRGRTSLQILNEVTNVLLRKRQTLSAAEIFAEVDALRFLGAAPLTESIVASARSIRISTQYSWWDCLLLASALDLGCTHFLSEDLQSGHQITDDTGRALTIIDPFAHSPEQILA